MPHLSFTPALKYSGLQPADVLYYTLFFFVKRRMSLYLQISGNEDR